MLIVANWKMNPPAKKDMIKLVESVEGGLWGIKGAATVLAPPFPWLNFVKRRLRKSKLGAQNTFWEKSGAYTGEVSPQMLKDSGVNYVIVGHSERRQKFGETDDMIAKKVKASIKSGLIPVVAVGEEHRGSFNSDGSLDNHIDSIVGEEVKKALSLLNPVEVRKVIFAYEPIWAISTTPGAKVALPQDALSAAIYIRKILTDFVSSKSAREMPILYGGSVDSKNVAAFAKEGGVDGFLVGGVSLRAKEFVELVENSLV